MTAKIVTAIACLLICCNVGRGGDCMTGSGVFQNREFPPQSDQFTVEFEATPLQAKMNGVTTLSLGPAMTFDDCAILIRFREDGRIVVRNGDGYASDVEVLYTVGESHCFRVQVNVPDHRYSVWVNPPSGAEVQIAADYDFRTLHTSRHRGDGT